MIDNNEEYFVEEITDERERPVGRGYLPKVLVKWLGYRELEWQLRANFEETEALDIWEQRVAAGEVTPTGRLEPKLRSKSYSGSARIIAGQIPRVHPSQQKP
ncbi:hypothetical protein BDV12DRAFT_204580 [Aspergillus spectabilis]